MFNFVVKRLGFLKSIPLMAVYYDSLIKLWVLLTNSSLLDWIDDIEEEVIRSLDCTVTVHKYGGSQFNYKTIEFAHLHSNGLLDVLLNRNLKQKLLEEGRILDHHVFPNTGWISFYIRERSDVDYAVYLLRIAYERTVNSV